MQLPEGEDVSHWTVVFVGTADSQTLVNFMMTYNRCKVGVSANFIGWRNSKVGVLIVLIGW